MDCFRFILSSPFSYWIRKHNWYFPGKFVSGAFLLVISATHLVSISFGCVVALVFVGVDLWRAFKQSKHWIPGDSLVLGSLSLLLLALLNNPSSFLNFSSADTSGGDFCEDPSKWMLVLAGRVSMCVLMGCLLPGVARSLSTNLWSDLVALLISTTPPFIHLSFETYILSVAYFKFHQHNPCSLDWEEERMNFFVNLPMLELWGVTLTMLVSITILVLLLCCASVASIAIRETVSHKIPAILSHSTTKFDLIVHGQSEVLWEKVEEQVLKSWIVVRTSNPQCIIARSILTSSVAFITMIFNGILVLRIIRTKFKVSTPFILRCIAIVIGSAVIYWRWITAVVYSTEKIEWKRSSFRKYFKTEDFWIRYFLELEVSYKIQEEIEIDESYLYKLMIKFCRRTRLYKLLPLLVRLQIFLVLFSKGCWLLSQLLLSNTYMRKLLMPSTFQEFSYLYGGKSRSEIRLGKGFDYEKYSEAFVTMPGENPAGLLAGNRKSIEDIKKQIARGEEEGNRCKELVRLLKNKSSPGFSGHTIADPQQGVPPSLEVERELDIRKHSCKMIAVSVITVLIELTSFTNDEDEATKRVDEAMEACRQVWSIMDLVENSDSEAVVLSKAADQLFEDLQKAHKWLEYHLPTSSSPDKSPESAKAAVQNLVEKGKEIANEYHFRTWNEVVAGYSLWRVCVSMDFSNFSKVEGVLEELLNVLADEIGSCIVRAPGVIMEDCEKWAITAEEGIWKAAHITGKVKRVMAAVGWNSNSSSGTEHAEQGLYFKTSAKKDGILTLRKHKTFQNK